MNHEKLKCYKELICVATQMPKLTRSLPRGSYYLEDQLKRALSSAILNLSEGNSRRTVKERNRFFDISTGSISEVMSAIDIMKAYGYIDSIFCNNLKSKLEICFKMVLNLRK